MERLTKRNLKKIPLWELCGVNLDCPYEKIDDMIDGLRNKYMANNKRSISRFTSGFSFGEDRDLFLVNTKYYKVEDDTTCFRISCISRDIQNATIENSYKIMRADIIDGLGNGWNVWIDFNDNGREEFRAYKIKYIK
jgi:hypothetical protein